MRSEGAHELSDALLRETDMILIVLTCGTKPSNSPAVCMLSYIRGLSCSVRNLDARAEISRCSRPINLKVKEDWSMQYIQLARVGSGLRACNGTITI